MKTANGDHCGGYNECRWEGIVLPSVQCWWALGRKGYPSEAVSFRGKDKRKDDGNVKWGEEAKKKGRNRFGRNCPT